MQNRVQLEADVAAYASEGLEAGDFVAVSRRSIGRTRGKTWWEIGIMYFQLYLIHFTADTV